METEKNIEQANETASKFIDLSKISQEQLWKRRQIEKEKIGVTSRHLTQFY